MANFFERQEEAQRNTTQLISTYVLTVGLLMLGTYLTSVFILEGDLVFQPWVFGAVTVGIPLGLVLMYKYQLSKLRQGGHVVARLLNGQRLDPSRAAMAGQQLINVVEEMAIATGTPAPPVYVLPEKGINAFSAGFTQEDAVIGVTRGAIDRLSRAELQGVVAHEFSHILNGDLGLNLRLVSWTRGISMIGFLGRVLLNRLMPLLPFLIFVILVILSGESQTGWAVVAETTAVVGTAMVGLGGLASLGAQLIKAQVSREREFLAEAAAVQFTRNPKGLGGALLKQRNWKHGSRVRASGVKAFRHLFFGNAVEADGWLAQWLPAPQWLATHPPIEERIRHVDPSLMEGASSREQDVPVEDEATDPSDEPFSPEALIERAGTLSPDMLDQAQALHAALPNALLEAAHEPLGAVALSYALVLDDDTSVRSEQLDVLWAQETPPVFDETKRLYDHASPLDRSLRLSLLEVAAPSLREVVSSSQQDQLRETIQALAEADARLTIFEFGLQTIVRHSLDPPDSSGKISAATTPSVRDEVAVLLSGLARTGHATEPETRAAFERAYSTLSETHDIGSATLGTPLPDALGTALDRLARTPLPLRKEILQACARCAMADEHITQAEAVLMRAVAVAMGVPLPLSVTEEANPNVAPSEA